MNSLRKMARQRLNNATKREFEKFLNEAQLKPIQEKIIRLHFAKDLPLCQIALILSCGESTVRKHLANAYDKIAFL